MQLLNAPTAQHKVGVSVGSQLLMGDDTSASHSSSLTEHGSWRQSGAC